MLRVHNQGMKMERVIETFLHANTGLEVPHIVACPRRPPNTWEHVIVFYVKEDIMHTLKRVWDHFGDPDMSRSISRLMRAGMHWMEAEQSLPLDEPDFQKENLELRTELLELRRAYEYEKKRADLASAGWKRCAKKRMTEKIVRYVRDGANARDTSIDDASPRFSYDPANRKYPW